MKYCTKPKIKHLKRPQLDLGKKYFQIELGEFFKLVLNYFQLQKE